MCLIVCVCILCPSGGEQSDRRRSEQSSGLEGRSEESTAGGEPSVTVEHGERMKIPATLNYMKKDKYINDSHFV